MSRRLFIHATNVHQGGGRTLLVALLESLPQKTDVILSVDSRILLPEHILQKVSVRFVRPSLIQRFFAETWLVSNVKSDDLVLCFGNLPPLLKLRGHVIVYIQNRYLIDYVTLRHFTFKVRLRINVEYFWLRNRITNVDEVIVQTPSMKALLEKRLKEKVLVRIMPFIEKNKGFSRRLHLSDIQVKEDVKFLYVASGEPHKNHKNLIEAWCLLAKDGVFPLLILTFDNIYFDELSTWLESKIEQYQLNVQNVGILTSEKLSTLYKRTDVLIYPSTFESLGLPLIEARQAGLAILASELDYIRDVIDPEQTFDPKSALSIARAVKRYMSIEEATLELHDSTSFLKYLLER